MDQYLRDVQKIKDLMSEPVQISEKTTCPQILDLVRSIAELVNFGLIVWRDYDFSDRLPSQRWCDFHDIIQNLQVMLESMEIRDMEQQILMIFINLENLKDITDTDEWELFCNRSHAVPLEKIENLKKELETFKTKAAIATCRYFLENQ